MAAVPDPVEDPSRLDCLKYALGNRAAPWGPKTTTEAAYGGHLVSKTVDDPLETIVHLLDAAC